MGVALACAPVCSASSSCAALANGRTDARHVPPRLACGCTMETIPFGAAPGDNAMRMPVAFSNALSLDVGAIRRLVWVSGQLAFDADNHLVGRGDVRAQTE